MESPRSKSRVPWQSGFCWQAEGTSKRKMKELHLAPPAVGDGSTRPTSGARTSCRGQVQLPAAGPAAHADLKSGRPGSTPDRRNLAPDSAERLARAPVAGVHLVESGRAQVELALGCSSAMRGIGRQRIDSLRLVQPAAAVVDRG